MRMPPMRSLTTVALAASLAVWGAQAAEEQPEKKTREELEQRIAELEKKIDTLTRQLEERHAADDPFAGMRERMKLDFGRDLDDLFDRMQRRMPFAGPHGPGFGPGFGRDPLFRDEDAFDVFRKPRLGVTLAPLSDSILERYRNQAEQGAVVMQVVPDSPADQAGLKEGDVITRFGGKAIASPDELVEAVRDAPAGAREALVMRGGKEMAVKVELAEAPEPREGMVTKKNVELKSSAFEMTEELAKLLKLDDAQKKKMAEVLAQHQSEAAKELSQAASPRRAWRGGYAYDVTGTVNKQLAKAKEALQGTLSEEQMRLWEGWLQTHNHTTFSSSMSIRSGEEETEPRP